jgi:hypothetical protein
VTAAPTETPSNTPLVTDTPPFTNTEAASLEVQPTETPTAATDVPVQSA